MFPWDQLCLTKREDGVASVDTVPHICFVQREAERGRAVSPYPHASCQLGPDHYRAVPTPALPPCAMPRRHDHHLHHLDRARGQLQLLLFVYIFSDPPSLALPAHDPIPRRQRE